MWGAVLRAAAAAGAAAAAVPALVLAAVACLAVRGVAASAYAACCTALGEIPEPACGGGVAAKYTWGHATWGLVGSMRGLRVSDVLAQMTAWRRAHGGVFVVRSLFGTPFVVIAADTAAVRRIAVAAPYRYCKSSVARRLMAPIVGDAGLIFTEGDGHRNLRKRIAPTMHHAAVAKYSAVFLSEADALRDRIAAAIRADPAAPLNMQRDVGGATCSIIVRNYFPTAVLSGVRLQRIKDLYNVVVAQMGTLAFEAIFQQLFPFLPARWITRSSDVKRLIRTEAHVMLDEAEGGDQLAGDDQVAGGDAAEERQAPAPAPTPASVPAPEPAPAPTPAPTLAPAPTTDASATVLEIIKSGANGALSKKEEYENLLTFLLAGQTTTAFAVGHALWRLARHEEWQRVVRAEVEGCAVWRDGKASAAARVDAVCALPALGRVLKETLRLHPPVAQTSRVLAEADELGGYAVPAGSHVQVSVIAMHMCEEHWERPAAFEPDRFLPEAEARRDRFAWMPFLFGPRGCIGQRFAMREMAVLVAEVVRAFDLSTDTQTLDPVAGGMMTYPAAGVFATLRKAEKTA